MIQHPFIVIATLFVSVIAAAAPLEQTPEPASARTDATIFVHERDAAAKLPSLVVAVRHPDGHHDVRTYGALDDGKAPDGDTAYELGSITKTFTALLFARAVADQRCAYTSTLGATLALPKDAAASSITFEQLATHTSGLPRLPANLDDAGSPRDDPYRDYTPKHLVDALVHAKLEDVGLVEYSNFGMGTLGYAITKDRGGYANVLRDDVVTPLALSRTRAFEPPPSTRVAAPTSNGKPTTPWHKTDAMIGAGGVWSTANDLMRVSDALIDAPRTPIDPPALRAALVDVFKKRVDAVDESHWFGLVKTKRPAVGLAWHIRKDGVRWHNGGTGGSSTMWLVDPSTGCAVVALTNAGDAHDEVERVAIDALDQCRRDQR